ncbi:MAG: DUF5680 domain-containing protein [Candidatus Pacearchaeota archaeon]
MTDNIQTIQPEIIKLGKLEINLEELRNFLVEAKKNSYAGNGEKQIAEDGSKILTFQKGNFYYTDNYAGYYQAPGSEIVRWQKPNGQRIWQMAYSGGMQPNLYGDKELVHATFEFLKRSLSKITKENPFRGPEGESFDEDEFKYWAYTSPKGNIKRFVGNEWISKGAIIFSQNFIGGLIIPE